MAIYKGNKEIVGLYKGLTEIIKRYKGSNLIYNVFKWLPYSYEHIYNSLVPSVINNKNVKEKAQVKTIYGNSVAENQLVPNDKIEQVITFETTDTNPKAIVNIDFIVGHKYLITCEQSATLSSNTRNTFTIGANYETTQSNANLQKGIRKWIYTHSGDGTALYIWCHSPNIQVSFTNFNIIDLNQ